jgi:hypothetical protein
MCVEPASQTALWLGIASFASSAVGSIASYQAQQQQYQGEMAAYQASQAAYNRQIQLNAEAANRAYAAGQMRLKNEYDKAAVDAQKVMATALQTQGKVLASGRVGKSIGLLAQDAERTYGKDMATLGMNLGYANQDYANAIAAANRMNRPSAPSALGLVSGIGGSLIGGLQTYNEFAPPNKKIG